MKIAITDLEDNKDIVEVQMLLSSFYTEIEHEVDPGISLESIIREFLKRGVFKIAKLHDEIIGLISLEESYSIYAGGKFGVIHELYVKPEYRSQGIGEKLMKTAFHVMKERGWSRFEVSTPEESKWGKTLAFYLREGFEITGVKLKKSI